MAPVSGDTVRVHYTGMLLDGSVFDSSEGSDPLEFTIGAGEVLPGFDAAVAALEVGGSTTVTIPAAEGYGERQDEGLQVYPREAFPQDAEDPEVGWGVELASPEGQSLAAIVAELSDESVTLDFNHPLAGQDLIFDITLVEIVE